MDDAVDIVGFAVDADDPWLIVNGDAYRMTWLQAVLLGRQLGAVAAEVRR